LENVEQDNSRVGKSWSNYRDITKTPVKVYGIMRTSGSKFIRCANDTAPSTIYNLVLKDCENNAPKLFISVYGGQKYFVMNERLEKEFMIGIVDAATTAGKELIT
jgi:SLOG in TRPM